MTAKRPKNIPRSPGVYIFRGKFGRMLYVGKATDLRARLSFYFRKDATRHPRLQKLINEARRLELVKTDSEIEALVKEAALIKTFRPKYNILMRDDKNYLFVVITREDFPKIILTHQPKSFPNHLKIIGPFTDASAVKNTLHLLRRIFPYCTCNVSHRRLCLNAEIGKCPGPCCTKVLNVTERARLKVTRKEYHANIAAIISILEGKKVSLLLRELKHELRDSARALNYERAARLRDQLQALEEILRHRTVVGQEEKNEKPWEPLELKIRSLLGIARPITRTEGYDISNISGTAATGSMVVFINGIPDKNEYRKFRVKTIKGANDVAMMAEIMGRRLSHPDWPEPDLIILDGGKPQLFTVLKKIRSERIKTRAFITALAKRDEELYIAGRNRPLQLKNQPRDVLHFFQRVRDEAHRFAKKYHHKLREMGFKKGS